LHGEVARLNDLDGKSYEASIFPSINATELVDVGASIADFLTQLKAIVEVSEEREVEISIFLQSSCDRSDDCPSQFLLAPAPSKEIRTAIHHMIKRFFPQYLDSDTTKPPAPSPTLGEISTPATESMQWIRLLSKHKLPKGTKKWRPQWPTNLPNYLKFVILKENIDTMTAANFISQQLRIKQDTIRFAGTKDKRAVTAQWATAYRMKPSALCRLNQYKSPFIRIGDFSYGPPLSHSLTHSLTLFSVSEPIAMGHLSGNHFEIVLREIQSDPSVVEAACEGLSSTGYVNYFGLQRFGRGGAESGSHLIGLEIFQAHWKAALGIMFQPNSSDRSDIHQAKVAYQRGDFSAALKLLPSSMYSEIRVCEKLRSDPHDYAGAYHSIPRSTQLICVHAFQSFIFNLATTQRCAVRILLSVLTPSLPSQD
jgi:tRNA pseudouridine13 synthase